MECTRTIVFNLKTTCFFFFRSKRLTIMLALQVLQSDDRMNPHQVTSHNEYRHEKMVRIVKMDIGKS